ncbi:MAG TPA: hypothetical protein VI789_07185 [Dehalococcoidia bacterium]|nr:hypothetical protein [Dehalococcoidia bacterium]
MPPKKANKTGHLEAMYREIVEKTEVAHVVENFVDASLKEIMPVIRAPYTYILEDRVTYGAYEDPI